MIWCHTQMIGMISGLDTIPPEPIIKLMLELLLIIYTLQAKFSLKNYLTKQFHLNKLIKSWMQINIYLINWELTNIMMLWVELQDSQLQMIIPWDYLWDWAKITFIMDKSLVRKLKKTLVLKFKINHGVLAQKLMLHI